jgi:NitT/TauT family transport system substrate-binding protein
MLLGLVKEAEPRTINVAVSARSLAQVAHYVAAEKGYYRDEGLDVRLILMSTPIAAQALIAGNVEFTGVSGGVLPAVVGGAPLRFVFSAFYRPMFWLYARPEIRTVTGLKAKKIAVSGLGSGPATLLLEYLKRHGFDGGRDFTILSLGITPTRFAALLNGSVDAAILIPPFTFAAAERGYRELISFIKEDFVELQGSIILREELLKSEPLLVEKFVRGTLKGLRFAQENRAATMPILARNVRTSEDLAAKDYDGARAAMTADGTVDEKMQRAYVDMGVRRLGVKEIPTIEKIFDFSLTKKVLSELDTKKWKPLP